MSANEGRRALAARWMLPAFLITCLALAPPSGTQEPQVSYTYDALGRLTVASYTTVDVTPPGIPGTPSFSAINATTASASWSGATDNVGVAGYEYRVYVPTQTVPTTWTSVGAATTANISGLIGGLPFRFDVRAYDAVGNRGAASTGTFSTPNPITNTFTAGASFVETQGGQTTVAAGYGVTGAGGIVTSCTGCSGGLNASGSTWLSPTTGDTNFGGYQVMATNNGCPYATTGFPFGSWITLTGQGGPVWGVNINDPTMEGLSAVCSITVQIQATENPGVILGTATVSINVFTGP